MNENIQLNIDEIEKEEDIILSELIDKLENTFVVMDQNNEELESENIKVSQIIDYQMNYTIKQLIIHIWDY